MRMQKQAGGLNNNNKDWFYFHRYCSLSIIAYSWTTFWREL